MSKKFDIGFVGQFAIDDFKTKYAGSLLGFIWAFLQPIITVVIYWFVFQICFQSAPVEGVPFIVWLVSGIIPWFFISDAIVNATSSLMDYSYLVKKVVFNIDILPIARIISVFFIQVILIVLAMVLCLAYGCGLHITLVQLVYYLAYAVVLCSGIAYMTSALYVFFKDIPQIVAIITQLVFWVTPIVWRIDIMSDSIRNILKYNPIFYVVNGYRDSLLGEKWFWQYSILDNLYYWMFAIIILILGMNVFKKLKPHFADVL